MTTSKDAPRAGSRTRSASADSTRTVPADQGGPRTPGAQRVDFRPPNGSKSTRRGPLSRERVLAAAMRVADTEGISAVTMRRVAASLGVEAMSLYHHLPGKDGLIDGLVETLVDEILAAARRARDADPPDAGSSAPAPAPAPASPDAAWRADLRGRILAARRVMLRHPWAPALIGSRPTIPPAAYAHFEAILGTLVRGGFSYHLGHQALHTLGTFALGYAPQVFDVAGTNAAAADEAATADMARLAAKLPHIVAMAASELHDAADPTLGWCDDQTEFEFTLDLLLDGLARARAAESR